MGRYERVYAGLPWWLQNVACSAAGWRIRRRRYGGRFPDVLRDTLERRSLSGNALHHYQKHHLIRHFQAGRESEFWRSRFADCGVHFPIEDPFAELEKLPVMRKEEVQGRAKTLVPAAVDPSQLVSVSTGGTTGGGLEFVETRESEWVRYAVWWRYWMEHGIERGNWCGFFTGRSVVGERDDSPPFHRWNLPGRQLLFDPNALRSSTARHYAEAIQRHRLPWIHGYPSVIADFSRMMLSQKIGPPECVEIVTTGAENLSDPERDVIREAFGTPVYEHYGLAESVANISQLADGTYCVDEDLAFVEFVPVDGERGELYRIVGTNFRNPAFPLFRYDTGDLVRLSNRPPYLPEANWSRSVESLSGRESDFIRLPHGRRGGPFNHIFKGMTAVAAAQVYQPRIDRLVFRIIPRPERDWEDVERELRSRARDRLGENIEIETERVSRLTRLPNGKVPLVLSDLTDSSGVADRD